MWPQERIDNATAALKEALAARGLDTEGSFAQLEERLVDAFEREQAAEQEQEQEQAVDVSSMSIKELKELISKARMSFDDCIDKAELRTRAAAAANALAAAQAAHRPMFAQPEAESPPNQHLPKVLIFYS